MTAIIKEIFLDAPPYFRTFITYNEDNNNWFEVCGVFPHGDRWVSLLVHKKPLLLECERCHNEIQILDETNFGYSIDWGTPWEQFLCEECHAQIWEEVLDGACGVCNTEPCKRGRECWANPWPRIMYLCYVAPRKTLQSSSVEQKGSNPISRRIDKTQIVPEHLDQGRVMSGETKLGTLDNLQLSKGNRGSPADLPPPGDYPLSRKDK